MGWLTKLPVLGGILDKVFERVWPDRSKHAEKALEIELEEARQSGGRITPRMLFKYMVISLFGLSVLWPLAAALLPGLPEFPLQIKDLLSLAGILFGFGG